MTMALRARPFTCAAGAAGRRLAPQRPLGAWGLLRPCVHAAGPQSGRAALVARAAGGESQQKSEEPPVKYNTEFGYSRKDILLIGAGLIALGYALYYGLQATGMEAGMAGNWVQLIIFMGICVGWVSTYLFRVATKVRRIRPWPQRAPVQRRLVGTALPAGMAKGDGSELPGAQRVARRAATWRARLRRAASAAAHALCPSWVPRQPHAARAQQMTYVKQLEAYEDAVMRKRLEEMTEEEMADLVREAEADKARKQQRQQPRP